MTKESLITSRDPKGRKAVENFAAAYDKMGLTDIQAQRLNEKGGEFAIGIRKLISSLIVSDQFKGEETSSSYTYPNGYAVLPIEEQVAKLKEIFPQLNGANLEIAKGELPEGAEGWFAIPRWDKIASTYNEAVIAVLALIGKSRKFYNYRNGELSEKYLRQSQRSIEKWEQLYSEQKGDIIIVATQFGMKHRGKSVRRARETFFANEFGLGVFATCSMLLTHPKRLQKSEELEFDCGGDEYNWYAGGVWSYCPYFGFDDVRVGFSARRVDDVSRYFGSASGFLGSAISA